MNKLIDKNKRQFAIEESSDVIKSMVKPLLKKGRIILLEGQLGAGKTTLMRLMCRELGVVDDITSPTFGYVNTYSGDDFLIHHFDLYRLSGLEEFITQGFEEYFHDQKALIVIEWSAIVRDLIHSQEDLARRTFWVRLEHCITRPETRFISVEGFFKE